MKQVRIPLLNVYGKGDFTATILVGSERVPVQLIVDTGSSTLAIDSKRYQAESDHYLRATPAVQEINYGIGGWAGALVYTQIHLGQDNGEAHSKVAIAVVESESDNMFLGADGILGLAFHRLNKSFDLSQYFLEQKVSPPLSLPWPFTIGTKGTKRTKDAQFINFKTFKHFLRSYPEHDVTPLFTNLVEQHALEDQFAFSVHRSSVHVNTPNESMVTHITENMKSDPLNQGTLVLGGGYDCTDLYQGEFISVPLLHHVYYNVELVSVNVQGQSKILAPPLEEKDKSNYCSNAIVDTGASVIALPQVMFDALKQQFAAVDSHFASLIESFAELNQQYVGVELDRVNLPAWPTLEFCFKGKGEQIVKLECTAEQYWQINTPEAGKGCFKIISQVSTWPNQSLIGLPLIAGYYTVFDRRGDSQLSDHGAIHFAQHKTKFN